MESAVFSVVIAAAVLGFVLYRQLQTRPVRGDRTFRRSAIIGVIGIVSISSFSKDHTLGTASWVVLAISLASGAIFGALRGWQVHVWRGDQSVILRQGNAITCVLWVVGIGVHILIDALGESIGHVPGGWGSTVILLYLAVTLATQQYIINERANRLEPHPMAPAPYAT